MGKLAAIVKREYLERVRTKWFIIATALVPVFMVIVTGLPIVLALGTPASSEAPRILILDATTSPVAERIALAIVRDSALGAPPVSDVAQMLKRTAPAALAAAESAATVDVIAGRFSGYLVVDSSTLRYGSTRYSGRNASSLVDMDRLEGVVRQRLLRYRMEQSGLDSARIDTLTRFRGSMHAERLSSRGREGSGAGGALVGYVVAFVMYMVLAIYGQTILRSVLEEKTTRVAEVVISSVSPDKLLGGKIIGIGALALTQITIWAASGFLLSRILQQLFQKAFASGAAAGESPAMSPLALFPSLPFATIVWLLIFFLLGVTFYCTLYAAAGATASSEQEAQQAATPLMFLLVPTIVLVSPILLNPTSTLAQVMSFLPFSSPVIMPMRMTLTTIPPLEMFASVVVLTISCYAALWVAARIYRTGMLMYGKRPSFTEVLRWVVRSR